MKMLVLGGSRFIGLHLVRLLHHQGHDVSVLNRGQTKAELPAGVTRLHADRSRADQVISALRGSSYDVAFDISGYTRASLLPVIEALDNRVGRFVFCSTTGVYAPSEVVPIDESFPLFRSPEASQYARDKVECEDLLMGIHGQGFPVTILRPPYVYGPDNYIRDREFSFFARLAQGRKVVIPGDGLTLIHLVHVDDLVAAFAAAPEHRQTLGQAYSVCGPDAITANGFVQTIGEAMGATPAVVHVPPAEYRAAGQQSYPYEWAASSVYSIEKARRDIGWAPKYRMADGLAMTYRWWLEQGLDEAPWDFSGEDELLEGRSAGGVA